MTDIENPPGFVARSVCEKAAWDNGWRVILGDQDGWIMRESHDAPARIGLAAGGPEGPWFLAIDHPGIVQELAAPVDLPGPGTARFAFSTSSEIDYAVSRTYDLVKSLPNTPVLQFHVKTSKMPRATEAERQVIVRVGQDIFRDALIRYWQGQCPLTGITDPELLRASHMKPWADCETDEERLDVHNGLLLSALWDAAFDRFLVTFDENGWPEFSQRLSSDARNKLEYDIVAPLRFTPRHLPFLSYHRSMYYHTLKP